MISSISTSFLFSVWRDNTRAHYHHFIRLGNRPITIEVVTSALEPTRAVAAYDVTQNHKLTSDSLFDSSTHTKCGWETAMMDGINAVLVIPIPKPDEFSNAKMLPHTKVKGIPLTGVSVCDHSEQEGGICISCVIEMISICISTAVDTQRRGLFSSNLELLERHLRTLQESMLRTISKEMVVVVRPTSPPPRNLCNDVIQKVVDRIVETTENPGQIHDRIDELRLQLPQQMVDVIQARAVVQCHNYLFDYLHNISNPTSIVAENSELFSAYFDTVRKYYFRREICHVCM